MLSNFQDTVFPGGRHGLVHAFGLGTFYEMGFQPYPRSSSSSSSWLIRANSVELLMLYPGAVWAGQHRLGSDSRICLCATKSQTVPFRIHYCQRLRTRAKTKKACVHSSTSSRPQGHWSDCTPETPGSIHEGGELGRLAPGHLALHVLALP
jgi:hypothetical protein